MPGDSPISPDIDLRRHTATYAAAPEIPHLVLAGVLREDVAWGAFDAFPPHGTEEWTAYTHFNEKKYGNTKLDSFPAPVRSVVEYLNSQEFVAELSALTGIPGLIPDPSLAGGGLHQSPPRGFLNIHADFTAHPHQRGWRRRVNLLLFLNPHHQSSWGGALELGGVVGHDRTQDARCEEALAQLDLALSQGSALGLLAGLGVEVRLP